MTFQPWREAVARPIGLAARHGPATDPRSLALTRMGFIAGGDERIAIDPATGRNRYGVPLEPAPDEVWFASSTASPATTRGRAAAAAALDAVIGPARVLSAADWSGAIRDRLSGMLGVPGCEVILAASGTDAELIILSLVRSILGPRLANIVIMASETGSGISLAASGRHFQTSSASGIPVKRGATLSGMEDLDVTVHDVPIRHPDGVPMAESEVERAVSACVDAALRAGRGVLCHRLETSKTGLRGFRRSAASTLAAGAPGRCIVVVDACQLRCTAEEIRHDLAAGSIVMVTGSKFVGGPPFAGAILLPPCIVDRLGSPSLPTGLAAYTALNDWPPRLRTRLDGGFATSSNLGLYARWEAALSEFDRFVAIGPAVRDEVVTRFGAHVCASLTQTPGIRLAPGDGPLGGLGRTIIPLLTTGPDGRAVCPARLRAGLTVSDPRGPAARRFHVGQPVTVGPDTALRLCLGAVQIADVAERLAAGLDPAAAFAPLGQDVDDLLAAWERLRMDCGVAT